MNAINYLKLDFRLIRGAIKNYLLIPLIIVLFSIKATPVMGTGYLFFFLIVLAASPFSAESSEKCDKMYYMFPSKITSMVLGRFLYLISMIIISWLIGGSMMMYFYELNIMSALEVGMICIAGLMATITCFCQHPIYYKFGMEKGKIISMFVYMAPAFLIFAFTSISSKGSFLTPEFLSSTLTFAINNKVLLPIFGILIISIIGIISYVFSCHICEKKEL